MTAMQHREGTLDHCRRCGGVFLERGQTALTLSPEADPDSWVKAKIATPMGPAKLRCPKDQQLFLAYRVAFGSAAVEVDVCSTCKGLWLDNFEGPKLRHITEEAGRLASGPSEVARLANAIPPPQPAPRMMQSSAAPAVLPDPDLVPQPGAASYFFQLLTGLPMEVHNPVRRKPVAIYSLIAILSVVFAFQFAAHASGGEQGSRAFNDGLWLVPTEFLSGRRLWTVLTCTFLHGGLLHLLGNLYFLWTFGDNVEDELGTNRFLLLYLGSGLAASLLHVAFNASSTIPCVGASGAIAGAMGAYLSIFPKTKLWIVLFFVRFRLGVIWYLGFWIIYQIVMGVMGMPGVAWYAHIGGFFAGIAFAPVLRKKRA
jgi:membrane associated rhomboid family serine protease/Zn-finger nucleic acid-binding protein